MSNRKFSPARFFQSQDGNMSLMAGFFIILLIAAGGIAIDASGAISTRADAQATLDGAVLASIVAANDVSNTDADVNSDGVSYFTDFFTPPFASTTISSVEVDYNRAASRADGRATVVYRPVVMGMFGYDEMNVSVTSTAVGAAGTPIDVGIMLDVSGSMEGAKLAGLKRAVISFLDIVIGDGNTSEAAKVAFAPFSTSVNAGPYAANFIGSPSLEGCVGERAGSTAFTDDAPNGSMFDVNGEFTITNDENDGEYREGYFKSYPPSPGLEEIDSTTICSESEIFPLTGNYDLLRAKVNGYEAAGITGGHIGIAHAWYLISEKWQSFWPTGRRPGLNSERDKIVILMTDGQFNTYFEAANGLPNDQGRQICENMKADNLTIYSISFDITGDTSDLLRFCADDPSSHFFEPNTPDELESAFIEIAQAINNGAVRLSD